MFSYGSVIGVEMFLVNGATPSLIERIVKMLSIAPAAPNVCPIAPLLAVTVHFFRFKWSFWNNLLIPTASARSPAKVLVA